MHAKCRMTSFFILIYRLKDRDQSSRIPVHSEKWRQKIAATKDNPPAVLAGANRCLFVADSGSVILKIYSPCWDENEEHTSLEEEVFW